MVQEARRVTCEPEFTAEQGQVDATPTYPQAHLPTSLRGPKVTLVGQKG